MNTKKSLGLILTLTVILFDVFVVCFECRIKLSEMPKAFHRVSRVAHSVFICLSRAVDLPAFGRFQGRQIQQRCSIIFRDLCAGVLAENERRQWESMRGWNVAENTRDKKQKSTLASAKRLDFIRAPSVSLSPSLGEIWIKIKNTAWYAIQSRKVNHNLTRQKPILEMFVRENESSSLYHIKVIKWWTESMNQGNMQNWNNMICVKLACFGRPLRKLVAPKIRTSKNFSTNAFPFIHQIKTRGFS